MPDLLQLAIDTSTSRPAAAVLNGEVPIADWLGPEDLRHHETLLAGIDTCLKTANISLKDLGFLSVGVGPGMFTGLRIGITTAKFLADPLGLACVPVSSLLALAWQTGLVPGKAVWAISDAKSKRVYALRLTNFSADFSPPEGEEIAMPPEEAAQLMQPGDCLLGEGAWLYRHLWPQGVELLPENRHALRATAIGALGARRHRLALTCTAQELEPKYLKTGQAYL